MIVDVHAHGVPPALMSELERDPGRFDAGFEERADGRYLVMNRRRFGPITTEWFDAERRLADMDTAGIDVQVLSLQPFLFCYWTEPGSAADIASHANEGFAAMAAETPRFWALGHLPLQSPELSLRELDHIAALGLPGVLIGANVEAMELDDPGLEPVWARLDELRMTVFVHPINPRVLPGMEPYHLTNLLGNPLDTSIALARLILSGVLGRYPAIRFFFAHGGGFIPFQYGRIDHAFRVREETSSVIDALPSSFLSGVWFDTVTHAEAPLRYLIDAMGDTQVVVGTDYPADMADNRIVATLAGLDLSGETRDRIEHENAERLFGLVG